MAMWKSIFCERALLPHGWSDNVRITTGSDGKITAVECNSSPIANEDKASGPVLPTLSNLHSHAFQRAMAGLAEVAGSSNDSFWTWRTLMYRVVSKLLPEDIETVATKLYSELLKGGFGRVVEFHYLHHSENGIPYSDPGENSLRILQAAKTTGIGLTHLPVFYAHSGFGGAEPTEGQRPFIHSTEAFLALHDRLRRPFNEAGAVLGAAIHSLRAATPEEMRILLDAGLGQGPLHIHVAEQQKEVDDCIAWSGRRPVEWLLDEMPVNNQWCAIHATQMTHEETVRLARTGAVAGLCPATEANLGDGIFPGTDFLAAGGMVGIGTDSHVATSVSEELRLLEYSQRLRDCQRNRLVSGAGASVGRTIFDASLSGGARASGVETVGIRVGAQADLVVLDGSSPFISTAIGDQILDRWLFALGPETVRDVMVAGQWVIRDRRHERDEEIDHAFQQVLRKLT
ncbi:formimidoylglutamate deiminase [Agrobacterium tumefaciens]|uniref:formimidoylglutamate deiminase n=1 Tax=Agrobacterium tumefaciens TaxID=358 RepID=UPI00045B82C9|nr:formimidoylglutamate deiminase [Agrobacterium tumefaciens]CDN95922.1 Formiminoglutamate deiminase [Agrobacterium tumefaciens]